MSENPENKHRRTESFTSQEVVVILGILALIAWFLYLLLG